MKSIRIRWQKIHAVIKALHIRVQMEVVCLFQTYARLVFTTALSFNVACAVKMTALSSHPFNQQASYFPSSL
jgi:hypothetical protein